MPPKLSCYPSTGNSLMQSGLKYFRPRSGQPVSRLGTEGPCIVNSDGVPVILQGVSIADPEHLERKRGAGSSGKIFDQAAAFGATVIRLPIHKGETPGWGLSNGVEQYLDTYIDPLVRRAEELGIYVIIDFHLISDYLPELDLARQFWQSASMRYGSTPNAIFELFNEPILPDSWSVWKSEFVTPLMAIIRANAPHTLVIVGSPHWSGHIREAMFDPVTTGPVAYTAHIYPEIPQVELRRNYQEIAGRLPLFVTEWGFNQQSEYPLRGTRADFGDQTVRWMNEHSISWTAWIYDNTWGQSMFDESWNLRGGDNFMGELVREQLQLAAPASPQ